MIIPSAAHRHTPAGTSIVRIERMSDAFCKYHLSDHRALHHFTQAEPHADPHDHPWPFITEVLEGGYVEEAFAVASPGRVLTGRYFREPGMTYRVPATRIHRIVDLPTGECWTLVKAGPHERVTRFWRFGDTIQSRAWNEQEWTYHNRELAA